MPPTVNWPAENTAFLVIHGNGPHRPYETLDKFVRGFDDMFRQENFKVEVKHALKRRKDWIQSYIRFKLPGKEAIIDFYEYYWDCYMVRDITPNELIKWLGNVDKGVKAFKKEIDAKRFKYSPLLFRFFTYCFGVVRWSIGVVRWSINLLICIFSYLLPSRVIQDFVTKNILKIATDTVIYTLSDQRSSYYEIRQKMLSGAVEELKALLDSKDPTNKDEDTVSRKYDQIIIAGHSLGSVIAYDALDRIAHDRSVPGGITATSAEKIKGLVTFGSFLDMVAFFFKERTSKENSVQRQILAHRHGFKTRELAPGKMEKEEPYIKDNPVKYDSLKVQWLNFYHPKDYVVNQELKAYKPDKQKDCEQKVKCHRFYKAHDCYWEDKEMYREIAREFFKTG